MVSALLIIDMQKGYFKEKLEQAALPGMIKRLNHLINDFDRVNMPVIHILTVHQADRSTWTRPMKSTGESFCIEGTDEVEIVPGLKVKPNHHKVIKTRDNGFLHTNLAKTLEHFRAEQLIFAGISTHECVAATSLEAAERDFLTVMATDCVFSPKDHYAECMKKLLSAEYGQRQLNNAEIAELLVGDMTA